MIDPERVDWIFRDCLFVDDAEVATDGPPVVGEGIMNFVGFHPRRLAAHKGEILGMLVELPTQFMKSGGGGWSFLNACNDKDGNQWTGMHQRMDQLFTLGIAIGKARWLMERDLWSALPGSMPYVMVDDT